MQMADKVDCSGCGRFLPGGLNRVSVLGRNIYLLMLGLDNAGKTCAAKSLVGESLDNVAPTIGFSKVSTKYKGFNVTIYDLGGSKSFRGIWPKYYHEVHGFIFIVDASDTERIEETAEVFQSILQDEKVKGKPILMLCNKADIDEAKDEVHLVNALNVERLVNVARCPTRVEPSVATKNQGVKEGFKWIVKSVIANMSELGPRIDKDVEAEQKLENERREEVRKRLEERKSKDEDNQESLDDNDDIDDEHPPGFVPIDEAIAAASEHRLPVPEGIDGIESNVDGPTTANEVVEPDEELKADDIGHDEDQNHVNEEGGGGKPNADETEEIDENKEDQILPGAIPEPEPPLKDPESLPPLVNGSSRRNSSSSNVKSNSSSRRNSHANGMENFLKSGKMDLEPTTGGGKKAPFGRRLSNSSVKTNASSKASSAGSRKSGKLPPVAKLSP